MCSDPRAADSAQHQPAHCAWARRRCADSTTQARRPGMITSAGSPCQSLNGALNGAFHAVLPTSRTFSSIPYPLPSPLTLSSHPVTLTSSFLTVSHRLLALLRSYAVGCTSPSLVRYSSPLRGRIFPYCVSCRRDSYDHVCIQSVSRYEAPPVRSSMQAVLAVTRSSPISNRRASFLTSRARPASTSRACVSTRSAAAAPLASTRAARATSTFAQSGQSPKGFRSGTVDVPRAAALRRER